MEIKITADKIRILPLPAFRSRTSEQDFHTLVWDREYKREIPNEVAQIFPGAYIAYSLCNPNQSPFCCKHFLAPANIAAEHSLFQIKQLVFEWNFEFCLFCLLFSSSRKTWNGTFYMAAHQIWELQNVSNFLFKISRVCLINSLVFCNIGSDWKGFWTKD